MDDSTHITKLLAESFSFWERLSAPEKAMLIQNTHISSYQPKQSIHCGENDCIGVILVESGRVRTYLVSDEGKEVTLYRLNSSDVCVLSATCVLEAITFDVYIEAETECSILHICSKAFAKLMKKNIYVEAFAYKLSTERFSDVMWTMQQILFTSFDKRLANFLLNESLIRGTDTLKITHEEIAHHLGSAREVVSRMLKYFSKEGLVQVERKDITLIDKKGLRKVAG